MVFCDNIAGQEACVVAWTFIGRSLIYIAILWGIFTLCVLITWTFLYVIRDLISKNPTSVLQKRWAKRFGVESTAMRFWATHPRLGLLNRLLFQVVPSLAVCVLWVTRAVNQQVSVAETIFETIFNVIFLMILLTRWLGSPHRLRIIYAPSTIIDVFSIGSFLTLLTSTCDWPIVTAEFTTGANCVSASDNIAPDDTITAYTWFSFSFLRAFYVRDLFYIIENLFPKGPSGAAFSTILYLFRVPLRLTHSSIHSMIARNSRHDENKIGKAERKQLVSKTVSSRNYSDVPTDRFGTAAGITSSSTPSRADNSFPNNRIVLDESSAHTTSIQNQVSSTYDTQNYASSDESDDSDDQTTSRNVSFMSWCKNHSCGRKKRKERNAEIEATEPSSNSNTWSATAILDRVRGNIAANSLQSSRYGTEGAASAVAAGAKGVTAALFNANGGEPERVLWDKFGWKAIRFVFEAIGLIFILSCSIYVVEVVGELPGIENSAEEENTSAGFWTQYQCDDGTRSVVQTPDCADEIFSPYVSWYFLMITFATIGYGDFSPTTSVARFMVVIFMVGGIVAFASAATKFVEILRQNRIPPPLRFDPIAKRFVVVLGSPSAVQLHDFLEELHHSDHVVETNKSRQRKFRRIGRFHRREKHQDEVNGNGANASERTPMVPPDMIENAALDIWQERIELLDNDNLRSDEFQQIDKLCSETLNMHLPSSTQSSPAPVKISAVQGNSEEHVGAVPTGSMWGKLLSFFGIDFLPKENSKKLHVVVLGTLSPACENWLMHRSRFAHPVYRRLREERKAKLQAAQDGENDESGESFDTPGLVPMEPNDGSNTSSQTAGSSAETRSAREHDIVTGRALGEYSTSTNETNTEFIGGRQSVIYIEGDPANAFDLARSGVEYAEAVFLLPSDSSNKYYKEHNDDHEDSRTSAGHGYSDNQMLHFVLSLRRYLTSLAQTKAKLRIKALVEVLVEWISERKKRSHPHGADEMPSSHIPNGDNHSRREIDNSISGPMQQMLQTANSALRENTVGSQNETHTSSQRTESFRELFRTISLNVGDQKLDHRPLQDAQEAETAFTTAFTEIMRQYTQDQMFTMRMLLGGAENIRHAVAAGVPAKWILSRDSLRYSMMGASTVFPGLSTLLANLITSRAPTAAASDSPGVMEYKDGACYELYSGEVPECLCGLSLGDAACCVLEITGSVEVGLVHQQIDGMRHTSSASSSSATMSVDTSGNLPQLSLAEHLLSGWMQSSWRIQEKTKENTRARFVSLKNSSIVLDDEPLKVDARDQTSVEYIYKDYIDRTMQCVHLVGCSTAVKNVGDQNKATDRARQCDSSVLLGAVDVILERGMRVFGMASDDRVFQHIHSKDFACRAIQWRAARRVFTTRLNRQAERHLTPQSQSQQPQPTTNEDLDAVTGINSPSDRVARTPRIFRQILSDSSSINRKMLFKKLQRFELAKKQGMKEPEPAQVVRGGHLLVICGPKASSDILIEFLRPIWCQAGGGLRLSGGSTKRSWVEVYPFPFILILHPNPPSEAEWTTGIANKIKEESEVPVYVLRGYPLSKLDLARAGIHTASRIAMLSAGEGYLPIGSSTAQYADATALFVLRFLQEETQNRLTWMIMQITSPLTIAYLRLDDPRGGATAFEHTTLYDSRYGRAPGELERFIRISDSRDVFAHSMRILSDARAVLRESDSQCAIHSLEKLRRMVLVHSGWMPSSLSPGFKAIPATASLLLASGRIRTQWHSLTPSTHRSLPAWHLKRIRAIYVETQRRLRSEFGRIIQQEPKLQSIMSARSLQDVLVVSKTLDPRHVACLVVYWAAQLAVCIQCIERIDDKHTLRRLIQRADRRSQAFRSTSENQESAAHSSPSSATPSAATHIVPTQEEYIQSQSSSRGQSSSDSMMLLSDASTPQVHGDIDVAYGYGISSEADQGEIHNTPEYASGSIFLSGISEAVVAASLYEPELISILQQFVRTPRYHPFRISNPNSSTKRRIQTLPDTLEYRAVVQLVSPPPNVWEDCFKQLPLFRKRHESRHTTCDSEQTKSRTRTANNNQSDTQEGTGSRFTSRNSSKQKVEDRHQKWSMDLMYPTYHQVYLTLTKRYNVLPLGLLRFAHTGSHRRNYAAVVSNRAHLRPLGMEREDYQSHLPYVYTAPDPDTMVAPGDAIYVLTYSGNPVLRAAVRIQRAVRLWLIEKKT